MEWRRCFPMRDIGRSQTRRGYLSIRPGIPGAAHIPTVSDGVSMPELLPQAHPAAVIHLRGSGTQGLLRPYTAWHSLCWIFLHFETHPHAACSTLGKSLAEQPGSDYFPGACSGRQGRRDGERSPIPGVDPVILKQGRLVPSAHIGHLSGSCRSICLSLCLALLDGEYQRLMTVFLRPQGAGNILGAVHDLPP